MTVREVLWAFPETRSVFDKYGMMGCGGADGPPEPVSFFAKMHGLTTAELLSELQGTIQAGNAGGMSPESTKAGSAPRPPESAAPQVPASLTPAGCGLHSKADPCPCGPDSEKNIPSTEDMKISPRAAQLLSAPDPKPSSSCTHGESAKSLARVFFRTGLVVFLVFGGTAGLIALLSISSPLVPLPEVLSWPALVQSHAHAQVFGFAAMIVLGISYHVMPRFMGVALRNVAAAWASYGLLLGGVILRCFYQPFAQQTPAAVTAILGSAMEVAAVIAFLAVVRSTVQEYKRKLPPGRQGQPFVHMQYLILGSTAFLAATILSLAGAGVMLIDRTNLQPPAINAVWINLSLVGFIGMFILGVGQRTMPHFLGLEHTRPAAGKAALAVLTVGLALQISSLMTPAAKLQIASSAFLEFIGFLLFFLAVPLLGRIPVHRPAAPPLFALFVRTAFTWGLLGTAGYTAASVAEAAGAGVQRPLVDAYRHAWTLGWITTLIVGVGYRLLPIFFGKEICRPRAITAIYAALTAAVAIRVGADIASLWIPSAYLWTSMSGVLALVAILLFAIEVWQLTSKEESAQSPQADSEITGSSNVAAVLDAHPELLPVFVRHGFGALQNPVARKTVARFVTIDQAARKHGIDAAAMIAELNGSRRK